MSDGKVSFGDVVAEFDSVAGETPDDVRSKRWYYRTQNSVGATREGQLDFNEPVNREVAKRAVRKRVGDARMGNLALRPTGPVIT